ncbi:MAG: hypothetical protein ACRCWG_03610 [Sarcina sp.]
MKNKHDNFGDIFFGFMLSITLFVFWVYGIALTSDISVSVSNSEAINQSIFCYIRIFIPILHQEPYFYIILYLLF